MPYEKRDNSGLIADNERKEKDTHPDMTGSVTINGVDMWISGWWKDGRKGRFLSLAFRDKDIQKGGSDYRPATTIRNPVGSGAGSQSRSYGEDIDDEIPF